MADLQAEQMMRPTQQVLCLQLLMTRQRRSAMPLWLAEELLQPSLACPVRLQWRWLPKCQVLGAQVAVTLL